MYMYDRFSRLFAIIYIYCYKKNAALNKQKRGATVNQAS